MRTQILCWFGILLGLRGAMPMVWAGLTTGVNVLGPLSASISNATVPVTTGKSMPTLPANYGQAALLMNPNAGSYPVTITAPSSTFLTNGILSAYV